jgi:hypothetical protein
VPRLLEPAYAGRSSRSTPSPTIAGLVTHSVHTGQCTRDSAEVPDVIDYQLDTGRQFRRRRVHRRQQGIQYPDAVPPGGAASGGRCPP